LKVNEKVQSLSSSSRSYLATMPIYLKSLHCSMPVDLIYRENDD
jgi:hypothetical protein